MSRTDYNGLDIDSAFEHALKDNYSDGSGIKKFALDLQGRLLKAINLPDSVRCISINSSAFFSIQDLLSVLNCTEEFINSTLEKEEAQYCQLTLLIDKCDFYVQQLFRNNITEELPSSVELINAKGVSLVKQALNIYPYNTTTRLARVLSNLGIDGYHKYVEEFKVHRLKSILINRYPWFLVTPLYEQFGEDKVNKIIKKNETPHNTTIISSDEISENDLCWSYPTKVTNYKFISLSLMALVCQLLGTTKPAIYDFRPQHIMLESKINCSKIIRNAFPDRLWVDKFQVEKFTIDIVFPYEQVGICFIDNKEESSVEENMSKDIVKTLLRDITWFYIDPTNAESIGSTIASLNEIFENYPLD